MQGKYQISMAYALENGIVFYSTRQRGWKAHSYLEDNGKITTCFEKSIVRRKQNVGAIVLKICMILLFGIFMLWSYLNFPAEIVIYLWRLIFLVQLVILISDFCVSLMNHTRIDGRSTLRFHSAEHMIVNAVNDLQRIPTLDEVKKYSRLSNCCGTNLVTFNICIAIVGLVATFLQSEFIIPFFIFTGFFLMILYKFGGLNFVQLLYTAPPTDRELKVAIAGVSMWFALEIGIIDVSIFDSPIN